MPIKDDHIQLDNHKIPLFAEDLAKLHSTLAKDTQFLSQNELGEYSLLIGVHNKSTILNNSFYSVILLIVLYYIFR
jgi:hypothetical protein